MMRLFTDYLASSIALTLSAVADPASLMDIIQRFGPLAGLLLWFIWRDFKRERRLGAKLDGMENYLRGLLADELRQSTIAITRNTEVMSEMKEVLKGCKANG